MRSSGSISVSISITPVLMMSASFLFLLFLVRPALAKLPPDQASTLATLSQQISSPALSWNATGDSDPCRWRGVTCSSDNSSVTGLSLSGLSLSSFAFLPTVCQIISLEVLDLSDNQLASIPGQFISSCGAIDGLRLLNFSRNRLVGPLPAFSNFSRLESLDVSFNSFNGTIGSELDGLVKLRRLNLSANGFTGPLPISSSMSGALEELQLELNQFQGPIPTKITEFQSLTLIDLSGNDLTGAVPSGIGQLRELRVLILSANALTGMIPSSLSNLTKLERLSANQNRLTGAIPGGLTRFLGSLDLSYNNLSGEIPSELLSPADLFYVDLSFNRLEGQIPAAISPAMIRLRLGSNLLRGTIPPSPFRGLDRLTYLELDNNTLTGSIPIELGHCRSLALLNLAGNELSGALPSEFGNLSSLQVLKLQLNSLSGGIPSVIGNLTSLSQLNMSWNMLTGSIPSSFSYLRNLTTLNLQHNDLNGTIPGSIANLDFLIELQLGKNRLSGAIPAMPSKLQIGLNLSSNLFEGQIPSTLSELKDLEVLDLSNNKFSGSIPDSLTKMGALIQLVLTNNQLSGVVPKFGSQVKIEIDGNPNLVQLPPPASTPATSSRKKGNSVALAVIVSLASAFLASLLAAVIVFSLSRRFYRVNDEQFQAVPQVVQGTLLTTNRIHRSSIDFGKAMEAVADPSKIISRTRFSTYYKATMPSGMCYYVKKLNSSDKIFQLASQEKFVQELEGLGRLNNSNIMTPLAYVLTVDGAYLFYEQAQMGTLYDVFHNGPNELDWSSRYSIAVGVAQGLAFLHDCSPGPILLLDLSSRSILLKSLKEPQVGDVELFKVIDPSKSTESLSTVAGSVGYIPPEYAYTMRMTMAGNVYSFGVVLLELLTGKPAVSDGIELAKWVSARTSQQHYWDRILDISFSRTSLAVRSQMLAVLKIALSCVSLSPEARPKMKSVLWMLLNAR